MTDELIERAASLIRHGKILITPAVKKAMLPQYAWFLKEIERAQSFRSVGRQAAQVWYASPFSDGEAAQVYMTNGQDIEEPIYEEVVRRIDYMPYALVVIATPAEGMGLVVMMPVEY